MSVLSSESYIQLSHVKWFSHDRSPFHLLSVCLQVMKLCGQMVEAGQKYTSCNQLFLSGLAEFTAYHKSDGVILVSTDVWWLELSDQTAHADLWLCVCFCRIACVSSTRACRKWSSFRRWVCACAMPKKIFVSLDHKTSHKAQFFEIENYTSSESWINNLSIDVWFVRIGQYLKIWNLRVQKKWQKLRKSPLKLSKWSS